MSLDVVVHIRDKVVVNSCHWPVNDQMSESVKLMGASLMSVRLL